MSVRSPLTKTASGAQSFKASIAAAMYGLVTTSPDIGVSSRRMCKSVIWASSISISISGRVGDAPTLVFLREVLSDQNLSAVLST